MEKNWIYSRGQALEGNPCVMSGYNCPREAIIVEERPETLARRKKFLTCW